MLISLIWIGCEDRTKVTVETKDNSEATMDDAYRTSKVELEKTLVDLRNSIDAKIQAIETEFETASDDRKAEMTIKLDGYRKQRNDLELLGKRIGDATAEGWSELERESAQVIADVKQAINN